MQSNITYSLPSQRILTAQDLQQLLDQTSWASARTVDEIGLMLRNTPLYLGAWEAGRLIGFARALTDGVYRALIDDVVVDASFRGKGVGNDLVQRLLNHLEPVEEVVLGCAEDVAPFYERMGFARANHPYMKRVRTA